MNIAVTGANGFVGSGLLKFLSNSGHNPIAIIRNGANTSLIEKYECRYIDYSDLQSIRTVLSDIDIVIHNAGSTKANSFAQMYEANVQTTRNLIRSLKSCPSVTQFIFISSQAASKPSINGAVISETDTPAPITWYGRSKLLAEELIAKESPIPYSIIRPCPIYGNGDKDFLQLVKVLNMGLDIRLGTTDKPMQMIHIHELCELISLCIANPKAFNQIFFATDGMTYTQSQVTGMMATILEKKPICITIPDFLCKSIFIIGDLMGKMSRKAGLLNKQKMKEIMADGWVCSIRKARDVLDFNPSPNLYEHLRETILWYKESSWL